MNNDTTVTIGCDVGDRRTFICEILPDGELRRCSIRTTRAAMRAHFERPPAHVVLEVGSHSRWIAALLAELGHRVSVANPRELQLITRSSNKTDENDAEKLARLGRADVTLLRPIQHRGADAQADLAVAKARDALVATRTKLVNHVRGTVKSLGERLPKCNADSFARTTRDMIPAVLKPALAPIYATLDALDEQIKEHDRTLKSLAEKYTDVDVVSQIDGVGLITAIVFVLTIGDKTRFTESRMVGAYLGLRPGKSQSGSSDPQMRITKCGDPFARRLLVNCANYILGPFGKDCDLRRWGQTLCKRGGSNARKRAKVAVARKLAVLMHRLSITGEVYEPLRNASTDNLAA